MMAIAAAGRSNMGLPVMMQYDPETQRTSLLFEDGNKETVTDKPQVFLEIGRASCRERVCLYV